jgi:hypothetical protein
VTDAVDGESVAMDGDVAVVDDCLPPAGEDSGEPVDPASEPETDVSDSDPVDTLADTATEPGATDVVDVEATGDSEGVADMSEDDCDLVDGATGDDSGASQEPVVDTIVDEPAGDAIADMSEDDCDLVDGETGDDSGASQEPVVDTIVDEPAGDAVAEMPEDDCDLVDGETGDDSGASQEPVVDTIVDQPAGDAVADMPEDDCDLVDGETGDDSGASQEPVVATTVDQPAGDLVAESTADDSVDQPSSSDEPGQMPGSELIAPDSMCDTGASDDADDRSDRQPETETDSGNDVLAGDLIAADESSDTQSETGVPAVIGLDALESVDNFFANYGDQLELNFNFFFGLDGIDAFPGRNPATT